MSRLQERVEAFKEYYRVREPLARGNTLPIILYHVIKALLFIGSCLFSVVMLANFPLEGVLRTVTGIILTVLVFWGINTIYTKAVKSWLHKKGYLEEPDIVLNFIEGVATDLGMGNDLKVLLQVEEFSKDPEVIMEPKHIQIPFDEPMVVMRKDGTGNKFYLSAVGAEFDLEIVKN